MEKIPLTSHQVLGFFFPGVVFAFQSFYCLYYKFSENGSIETCFKHYKDDGVAVTFLILVGAIISGLFFDSIRNAFLENFFDKKFKQIKWDYFFEKDKDQVGMLYARYYNYYVYDVNVCIALFLSCTMLFSFLEFKNVIWIGVVEFLVIVVL